MVQAQTPKPDRDPPHDHGDAIGSYEALGPAAYGWDCFRDKKIVEEQIAAAAEAVAQSEPPPRIA